ncbi:MAG: radical SAM protein [bacterium]
MLAPPLGPAPKVGIRPTYVYWGGENLYVNLTSRCSSACVFCLRESTWEVFGSDLYLSEEDEPTAADVIAALETEMGRAPGATPAMAKDAAEKVTDRAAEAAAGAAGPREVVFTGLGEPTVRLDVLLEVVRWLTAIGLTSRVDTNGHASLLHPDRAVVAELVAAGLDRVSVSLNAPDTASYDELCRPTHPGGFVAVLGFVRDSVQAGLETTVTMVGIPGLPAGPVARLAAELGAAFRVRPYLPPRTGQ